MLEQEKVVAVCHVLQPRGEPRLELGVHFFGIILEFIR